MSRKLLVASLVGAGVVVALALGVDRPHVVYAYSVSRFMKEPMRETEVRVTGRLVHGSMCRISEPCEYRFRLMGDGGEELPVSYPDCVVPDTFRDMEGLDVTVGVEGALCGNCHTFKASSIVARCPGKYEMRSHGAMLPPKPVPECPR